MRVSVGVWVDQIQNSLFKGSNQQIQMENKNREYAYNGQMIKMIHISR